MTTAMMVQLAGQERPGVSESSVISLIKQAEDLGFLRRVRSGLYLNLQALPGPDIANAAEFIRRGAVVSFHTVLGDAGILNNPTPIIFAAVPFMKGEGIPNVGYLEADDAEFYFYALPQDVVCAGDADDRLDADYFYPRATNEAALCHWIYLAESRYSRLTWPPLDCDLDDIDRDRLERLALAMDIEASVAEWVARVDDYADQPDYEPTLGF